MKSRSPFLVVIRAILFAALAIAADRAVADTIVAPANLVGHWVADDWSGNISEPWVSRIEITSNTSTGEKIYSPAPVYVGTPVKLQGEDGFNAPVAKDGIRFNGNSYFSVSYLHNPLAPLNGVAAKKMTAIVLFRTDSNGLSTGTAWYQSSGIVSSDTTGTSSNDWGLAINASGETRAGVGGATAAGSDGASAFVADGKLHTLAFTWGDRPTNDGIGRMYLDGKLVGETPVWGNEVDGTLVSTSIAIGSGKGSGQRFTGDIAEIRLYNDIVDVAAVHAEMVPEPGTLALLATGTLCASAFLLRRKRFR